LSNAEGDVPNLFLVNGKHMKFSLVNGESFIGFLFSLFIILESQLRVVIIKNIVLPL
jgi:hypothetical protein